MTSPSNSPTSLNLSAALKALHRGDLSYRLPVEGTPDERELAAAHNQHLDRMQLMHKELTRIAEESGTEGRFGGQAEIDGLEGSWAALVDAINLMNGNLTNQVRLFAQTITSIATGDLTKKVMVDCEGELLELKKTINIMVDQFNSFAYEMTVVVRSTGTDSKLGAQAEVKGISGSWKDVITSLNLMSEHLATQIRNISEVAGALSAGDTTKRVTAECKGEMLRLKEQINALADRLQKA